MPTCLFRRTAPLVCAMLTAACASLPPTSATPPMISLPAAATTPCRLPVLPDPATLVDLERVYAERGAALIACDGARRLALDVLAAERALGDP